jgi:deazaflavin-dependent oxidoreductase (nitroreductase family)
MNGNDFMSWVLRSPFHGLLSDGMMLITVSGRKTGKKYATPVGYYRENGTLWVITSRNRTWWRNLRGGAKVSLLLKRKPVHGFAELELDETAVESRLVEYLRHIPQAVNSWKIRMENDRPNAEDIARIARVRLFVKVKLLE